MSIKQQDAYWKRAMKGRLLPHPRVGNKTPLEGHNTMPEIANDAAPVFGSSGKWFRHVDMGGEVTAESDQDGHHHVYLSSFEDTDYRFGWCGECNCWVDGVCDHENRNICRERREAVLCRS